jgi:LPXTG-motif cell wall-anchored protein
VRATSAGAVAHADTNAHLYAGTAGGLFFSAAEIGGAGGPIMLGVLYDATGGFDSGLYLLAGIGLLLAIAALHLRRISV